MKRILSFLLSILMVISMLPVGALAAATEETPTTAVTEETTAPTVTEETTEPPTEETPEPPTTEDPKEESQPEPAPANAAGMAQEVLRDLLAAAMEAGEREFTLTSSVTLTGAFETAFNGFLTIGEGGSLTVPEGTSLTMENCRIHIDPGGTMTIAGSVSLPDIDVQGGTLTVSGSDPTVNCTIGLHLTADGAKDGTIYGVENNGIKAFLSVQTPAQLNKLAELGEIYGQVFMTVNNTVTLAGDVTVPANAYLSLGMDQTLTVPSGVTLTNNGNVTIWDNGGLVVEAGGTLVNSGRVDGYDGAFYKNYGTETNNGTLGLENTKDDVPAGDTMTQAQLLEALAENDNYYILDQKVVLDEAMELPDYCYLYVDQGGEIVVPQGAELSDGMHSRLDLGGGTLTVEGTLSLDQHRSLALQDGSTLRFGQTAVKNFTEDSVFAYLGHDIYLTGITEGEMGAVSYVGDTQGVVDALAYAAPFKKATIEMDQVMTLEQDVTIPENCTLLIAGMTYDNGEEYPASLTIPNGFTLTNNGALVCGNLGTVTLDQGGTLINNGTFYQEEGGQFINNGAFQDNGSGGDTPSDNTMSQADLVAELEALPDGEDYILTKEVTLDSDLTLTEKNIYINEGGKLIVPQGVTLTAAGRACLYVYADDGLVVDGTFRINSIDVAVYLHNACTVGGTLDLQNGNLTVYAALTVEGAFHQEYGYFDLYGDLLVKGAFTKGPGSMDIYAGSFTAAPGSVVTGSDIRVELGNDIQLSGVDHSMFSADGYPTTGEQLAACLQESAGFDSAYIIIQNDMTLTQSLTILENQSLGVGYWGNPATLTLADGAVLTNYSDSLGVNTDSALVLEAGSQLINHNWMSISDGSLILKAGSTLTNNGELDAYFSSSSITLEAGSTLTNTGLFRVSGEVTFTQEDGAIVNNTGTLDIAGTDMTEAEFLAAIAQAKENGYGYLDLSRKVTLTQDLVLDSGFELYLYDKSSLTVAQGATLTVANGGALYLSDKGALTVNGTLSLKADRALRLTGSDSSLTFGEQAVKDFHLGAILYNTDSVTLTGITTQELVAVDSVWGEAELTSALTKYAEFGYVELYGTNAITLTGDLTIPANCTLILDGTHSYQEVILDVGSGMTLTNNGQIKVAQNGFLRLDPDARFVNNGTVTLVKGGVFEFEGVVEGSGDIVDKRTMSQDEFEQAIQDAKQGIENYYDNYTLESAVVLTRDFTLEPMMQLMIDEGGSITVAEGVTFTVSDDADILNHGGDIQVQGKLAFGDSYSYLHLNNGMLYIAETGEVDFDLGDIRISPYGNPVVIGIPEDMLCLSLALIRGISLEDAIGATSDYGMVSVSLDYDLTVENSVTLPANFELNISGYGDDTGEHSRTLTIPAGVEVVNEGVIEVNWLGSLIIEEGAVLQNNGIIYRYGGEIQGEILGNQPTGGGYLPTTGVNTEEELRSAIEADEGGDIVFSGDITLTENLTVDCTDSWVNIYGTIVVPKGRTLTVKTHLYIVAGGIEVQEGGKLVLSGSGLIQAVGGSLNVDGTASIGSGCTVVLTPDQGGQITGIPVSKIQMNFAVNTMEALKAAIAMSEGCKWLTLYVDKDLHITEDVTIPENAYLHIESWDEIINVFLSEGVTLTNEGEIYVAETASLSVAKNAVLANNGKMYVAGLYTNKGRHTGSSVELLEGGILGSYHLDISGPDTVLGGKSVTLEAEFLPGNLTGTSVEWALVDGSEEYASLKVSKGKAVVTAKDVTDSVTVYVWAWTKDGNAYAQGFELTIHPAPKALELYQVHRGADGEEWEVLTNNTYSLVDRDYVDVRLAAEAIPGGADLNVIWESSNPDVADFLPAAEDDETVTLRFTNPGTTDITATVEGTKVSVSRLLAASRFDHMDVEDGIGELELVSGKSKTLKLINKYTGKAYGSKEVSWYLAPVDDAWDTFSPVSQITTAGKLTTKNVMTQESFLAVGQVIEDGMYMGQAEYYITVYPKATMVVLGHAEDSGETRMLAEGETITLDTMQEDPVVYLAGVALPVDAKQKGNLKWTSSNPKIADVAQVEDGFAVVYPTGDKTGTVTITAAAQDGSKKKATVKVAVGALTNEIDIKVVKGGFQMEGFDCVRSGQSMTLGADTWADKDAGIRSTKSGVTWEITEGQEAATISASGKITAKSVTTPDEVTVLATSKDGGATKEYVIAILPKTDVSYALTEEEDIYTLLNKQTLYLEENDTYIMGVHRIALFENAEGWPMDWKTSKDSVAMLAVKNEDGELVEVSAPKGEDYVRVIAKGPGTATITATGKDENGKKLSFSVTIKVGDLSDHVTVEASEAKVASGKSVTLKAEAWADEAETILPATKGVVWSLLEGDEAYAKITAAGKLTANKNIPDVVEVTAIATPKDGVCEPAYVTVSIHPAATAVEIFANGSYTTGAQRWAANIGMEMTLSAVVYPYVEEVESLNAMQDVDWKSSNEKILSIDPDTGAVTFGEKTGTVTITATAQDGTGKKASFKVTTYNAVTSLEMNNAAIAGGKSLKLDSLIVSNSINEDATSKKLAYEIVDGDGIPFASISGTTLKTQKVTSTMTLILVAYDADYGRYLDDESRSEFRITIHPAATSVEITANGMPATGAQRWAANVGLEMSLSATVYPYQDNISTSAWQGVTWKSSNEDILTIDSEGNVFFGDKVGAVTITATADDGTGKKASFKVTTYNAVTDMEMNNGFIGGGKDLKLDSLIDSITEDATSKKLTYQILGGEGAAYASVKGTTLKTQKVTEPVELQLVAYDADSHQYLSDPEKAVFTVTISPVTTKIILYTYGYMENGEWGPVPVSGTMEVPKGGTLDITAMPQDEGAYELFDWKVSNVKHAGIREWTWDSESLVATKTDSDFAILEGVAVGKTVTITVTARDGSGVKATVKVRVVEGEDDGPGSTGSTGSTGPAA